MCRCYSTNCILIGLGEQAKAEIFPALLKHKDLYNIIAICDIDQKRLNEAKDIFPDASMYTDYIKCINSEHHADVAIVSLPHFLYLDVVMGCLHRGLDVFKEKPLSNRFSEVEILIDQAYKQNKKIYTITKRNFYRSYIRAGELLSSLGVIYQYTATHFVTGGNIHKGWKSNFKEASGGVGINLAYHILDQLIKYFGPVVSGYMCSSNVGNENFQYEVEDSATALLLHESNVYGSFQFNCYTGIKEERIEIHATKGKLIVSKNEVQLYSPQGDRKLYEVFENDSIAAYEEALHLFNNAPKYVCEENLLHHALVIKALDILYNNNTSIYGKIN